LFGFEPHLPQTDVAISDARYKFSCAGTRGGKSRLAGEDAAVYLMAGATRVWIVGQSYALTAKEFDYVYERMVSQELRDFLGFNPIEHCIYNESQGNMSIRTKWGSWIKCISLERPGGAFGEEVDLIIMSEAAQIKNPKKLYQRILRGRLSSRLGDLHIPTTPAGKSSEWDQDGWLYEMYNRGKDINQPDYFTREWPSWANPFWPENPYELRRELDPLIFAEQYCGQFVVFTGSIFSKFYAPVHTINPFYIPTHWRRYEAIDPGFRGEFAWTGSVMSEQGNLYFTGEYEDQETSYEERVFNIKNARCSEYGIQGGWYNRDMGVHVWDVFAKEHNIQVTTYIDPEDPQCAFEFTRLGLPCIKANNNVMIGVDRVQRRLSYDRVHSPRLYFTYNVPKCIDSMTHHAWGEKQGQIRKPANDVFKHKADTIRYVCAGNLVASEPAQIIQPVGDLYATLMDMQENAREVHPHELSFSGRRGGY
jgi:hypothetical protein